MTKVSFIGFLVHGSHPLEYVWILLSILSVLLTVLAIKLAYSIWIKQIKISNKQTNIGTYLSNIISLVKITIYHLIYIL